MRSLRSPNLSALGEVIRERRRVLGLTQHQLAERLRWSQERISTLETGKYGMPSLPLLARLAEALEVPLAALMDAAGFHVESAREGEQPPEHEEGSAGIEAAARFTLQRLLAVQALTLKDAMNEASDVLAETMGADKIDAFMYQPETASLVALGTSNTAMGRREQQTGLDRVPVANGGREVEVFESGEPFYTGQADRDPSIARGVVEVLGVRSLCAVPLRVNQRIRGVLVAASSRPDRFSPADREFFAAASRWVGTIAHRAELYEELTQRTAQETRRLAAEEMLAVVAHDLGNQITPIKGRIDLLVRQVWRQSSPDGARWGTELAELSTALGRLSGMVHDLLDASRLEGGVFSIVPERVDLVQLVHEVVHAAKRDRPEIEALTPDELLLHADPRRIRQVVENLVGNAVQHTPPGVPVLVSVGRRQRDGGECVVVEVRDEGPGIAPELLPRLFTRYVTGGESAGVGLGLYLASELVSAHGGDLSVQSEIGQGTTFSVLLPCPGTSQGT